MIQPQINGLVVGGRYQKAVQLLEHNEQAYGHKNTLLYRLDFGLLLHLAGRYHESIKEFQSAQKEFDQLYTISLTKEITTWLVNDYSAPYRGEDFEQVLLRVFQALNFVALGDIEEALVEARAVDSYLAAVNRQYPIDQQNVYKEDAWARFLMGILYEASGTESDLNNAYISYVKAAEIYQRDYETSYQVQIPEILKQNILTLAHWMGKDELRKQQEQYPRTPWIPLKKKALKGELIFIQYAGFSPIKRQEALVVPLPNGYVTKLAFPVYKKRSTQLDNKILVIEKKDHTKVKSQMILVEDVGEIAIKNLENRKMRVLAKAMLRPVGKYFLESSQERVIQKKYGQDAGNWFRYLSSLYNISTEQADLRSWQTLPEQIYMTCLILDSGEYQLRLNDQPLGKIQIRAGEKKFVINPLGK